MSIEIVNGRVFIEGKETINPEHIGYAVLDHAEDNQNSLLQPINDKTLLSIINNQVELSALNRFIEREFPAVLESKICSYWEQRHFDVNWMSSDVLFNLVMMIKNGQLVFNVANECNAFPNRTEEIVFVKKD